MTPPRRKLVAIDDPLGAPADPAPSMPKPPAPSPRTEETAGLFVRLPLAESERLARAAFELRAHKREIVAALIATHIDATSDAGRASIRALLDGYRERPISAYPSMRSFGGESRGRAT